MPRMMIMDLMKKAPKPDEMDAYGEGEDSDGAEKDEDADSAAAMSAMEDYIKAVKAGDAKASLALFKELVGYC